jgi:hypothetical protein
VAVLGMEQSGVISQESLGGREQGKQGEVNEWWLQPGPWNRGDRSHGSYA